MSIKKLVPKEFVRSHPERYWNGNATPGPAEVNAAIVEQLADDGFSDVQLYAQDGWQMVCCEPGWAEFVELNFGSVDHPFKEAIGIPGGVAGGLRVEWFVAVLAVAIRVWVRGRLVYSDGVAEFFPDRSMINNFHDRVCIAYLLAD